MDSIQPLVVVLLLTLVAVVAVIDLQELLVLLELVELVTEQELLLQQVTELPILAVAAAEEDTMDPLVHELVVMVVLES